MSKRDYQREAARRVLWGDRKSLLPHLLEHRRCGVAAAVAVTCETAGWTMESYLLAALFDREDLLSETS